MTLPQVVRKCGFQVGEALLQLVGMNYGERVHLAEAECHLYPSNIIG